VESDLASVGVTMHQRRAILEARREKRGATFAVEFVSVKESVMGERPPLNALGAILPKPASHKATEPSKLGAKCPAGVQNATKFGGASALPVAAAGYAFFLRSFSARAGQFETAHLARVISSGGMASLRMIG